MSVIDLFVPVRGNGIPAWGWPILILLWTPGIVGILPGYYSIARYPALSLSLDWQPTFTSTRWLWLLFGSVFCLIGLVAALMLPAAIVEHDFWASICFAYTAIACIFAGFLLTFFDARRYPTIATFLHVSWFVGAAFVPIYLPALIVGSYRLRHSRSCKGHNKRIDQSLNA
ncbi:MAG: hypothetical protein ACR2NP_06950 [Pirellulaceae bacterium]